MRFDRCKLRHWQTWTLFFIPASCASLHALHVLYLQMFWQIHIYALGKEYKMHYLKYHQVWLWTRSGKRADTNSIQIVLLLTGKVTRKVCRIRFMTHMETARSVRGCKVWICLATGVGLYLYEHHHFCNLWQVSFWLFCSLISAESRSKMIPVPVHHKEICVGHAATEIDRFDHDLKWFKSIWSCFETDWNWLKPVFSVFSFRTVSGACGGRVCESPGDRLKSPRARSTIRIIQTRIFLESTSIHKLYIYNQYTISIPLRYLCDTFAIPLRYLCDLWSQNPWNPHCHTIHVLSSDGLCRILWTGCKRPHIWSSFNVSTSWKWLRQVHWVGSVWKCLESEARS